MNATEAANQACNEAMKHPKGRRILALMDAISGALSRFDDDTEVQEIAMRLMSQAVEHKKEWLRARS